MSIVTVLAAGLPSRNSAKMKKADVRLNHGALRTSCFVVPVANGDSATSTYEIARLPSHAVIKKSSVIHSTGIAGLTDVDLGVAGAVDVLLNGANLTAAGSSPAAAAIPVASLEKPLWELAGMSKDPGQELAVFITINTDATALGVICADLVYVTE